MENGVKPSYEIKDLIKTFQKHHDLHMIHLKELDEKYPDQEYKKNIIDYDFSMCLAMKSICEDLVRLQDWISRVEDQIDGHTFD